MEEIRLLPLSKKQSPLPLPSPPPLLSFLSLLPPGQWCNQKGPSPLWLGRRLLLCKVQSGARVYLCERRSAGKCMPLLLQGQKSKCDPVHHLGTNREIWGKPPPSIFFANSPRELGCSEMASWRLEILLLSIGNLTNKLYWLNLPLLGC